MDDHSMNRWKFLRFQNGVEWIRRREIVERIRADLAHPQNVNRMICPDGAYFREGLSAGGEALNDSQFKDIRAIQGVLEKQSGGNSKVGK